MAAENTQDLLNRILIDTLSGVEQAKHFVVEQAPDVVRQFLKWRLMEAYVGIGICLLVWVGLIFLGRRLIRWIKKDMQEQNAKVDANKDFRYVGGRKDWDDYLVALVPGGIVALILLLVSFIDGVSDLHDAIQITVAPKVFLLEYTASLVKGQSK